MKQYSISLTITDEDTNKQLVSLQVPHLTAKQIAELNGLAVSTILPEPEPEILTIPKPERNKRRSIKRMLSHQIDPPIEPLTPLQADQEQIAREMEEL